MMNQQSRHQALRMILRALSLLLSVVLLVGGTQLAFPRTQAYAATTSNANATTYLGCSGSTEPASDYPMYKITVISPFCDTTINGMTTVTFVAPGMKNVWASIWHQPDAQHPDPNGWDDRFQQVTPDITGNTPSTITFDANTFPHGPIVIDINAWDTPDGGNNYTHSDRYHLQLYNNGGVTWNEGIPAPPPEAKGMALAYQDDFQGPLSISPTGDNTTYASLKPDYPNGSQFGDAIMADPSTGPYNPFAILDHQFLRIRAIKAPPGTVDPDGWGRTYESGMLSAGHVNGTTVGSVSDGYYEVRMMLPAEEGTWPAFWNLSTDSIGPNRLSTASELDTMEGYGQFPSTFCQTWHYWGTTPTGDGTCNTGGTPYTPDPGTYSDNDMSTWHTFGLKITPTDISWYVDNKKTWEAPAAVQSQDPQFFMINLELGSGWPIDLTRYNNQADMYVDWVRVFKPVGVLGTYRLVNRNSSQVLDVQGSSMAANTPLVQEPLNDSSASQVWQYAVTPQTQDTGQYNLINQNSGKGAVVQGSGADDGLPIIQRPNLGDSSDEWQLAPVGDGYYKIVRNSGNGTEVMDVAGDSNAGGAAIIQDTWNDSPSQEWKLVPVSQQSN